MAIAGRNEWRLPGCLAACLQARLLVAVVRNFVPIACCFIKVVRARTYHFAATVAAVRRYYYSLCSATFARRPFGLPAALAAVGVSAAALPTTTDTGETPAG